MKLNELKTLKPGDNIFWNDPNDNIWLSHNIKIKEITFKDNIVCITDEYDDYQEFNSKDLS